jgi:hypothetical protein
MNRKDLLVTLGVVGLLVLYQHLFILKLMLVVKSPHHVRALLLLPYHNTYSIDAPATIGQQPNPRKRSPPPTKLHNK